MPGLQALSAYLIGTMGFALDLYRRKRGIEGGGLKEGRKRIMGKEVRDING